MPIPFKPLAFAALSLSACVTQAYAGGVPLEKASLHGDETIQTSIGDIKLQDSYFDDATSQRLFDEMDYQRASQAYIGVHRWSVSRPGAITRASRSGSPKTPILWCWSHSRKNVASLPAT